MIAHLSGNIIKKTSDGIILDVHGVGYYLHVATPTIDKLQSDKVNLLVHTHVTENSISLFGFLSDSELNLFNLLISISGIGPKMAISILCFPPEKISQAILNSDSAYLTEVPGVGKKMAERIILELKNKIELDGNSNIPAQSGSLANEAIEALQSLGYTKSDSVRVVSSSPSDISSLEDLIKYALKVLSS